MYSNKRVSIKKIKMNQNTVEIPDHIKRNKTVECKVKYDEKNFLYCIIRHIWPETKKVKNYKKLSVYEKNFNLQGIKFPLDFSQIKKFVKNNAHLPLTVRVLFEGELEISVLDIFSNIKNKEEKYRKVLNLLMIRSDEFLKKNKELFVNDRTSLKKLNIQQHYFVIKSLSGFLNYHKFNPITKKKLNYLYCTICLMKFRSKSKLKDHTEICQRDKQRVLYPAEGDVLNFSKQRNAFKAPVIGFADFECCMKKTSEPEQCENCKKNLEICDCEKSAHEDINRHAACGFSICFVDSDNDVFFQETYGGEDAVEVFLNRLQEYEKIVYERKQRFRQTKDIKASEYEWQEYHNATQCHICKKEFDPASFMYKKVVDHDHVNGKIIQAAHRICNLHRQGPYLTPIYFHNAQG